MVLALTERLLFPAGRTFVPFPIRRCVLQALERARPRDSALLREVLREPQDLSRPPRAWQATSGLAWLRLEAALATGGHAETADDWLALHGPCESLAEERFVRDVIAPALGSIGLRALRAQEVFPLPSGRFGRLDFVLGLSGVRIAIEIDGLAHHEGAGPDGHRPETERERQNAITSAGYVLFRYTARSVLESPAVVGTALLQRLDQLGVLQHTAGFSTDPLRITAATQTLLATWPRAFVAAQQAGLSFVADAAQVAVSSSLRVLVPRSFHGAAALGILDAIEAWVTAHALHGVEAPVREVELWIGDSDTMTSSLLSAWAVRTERSDRLVCTLRQEGIPTEAELLYVSTEAADLTDEELDALCAALRPNGVVMWATEADVEAQAPKREEPRGFAAPPRAAVEAALDRFFGFPQFRSGQWEIVEALLRGISTLGVLPTGAGKTVCFQLPALLQPGLALVVSPLVSLMDDQVINLRASGMDFAGLAHSKQTPDEQEAERRAFRSGRYKLFYVSPERFHSRAFLASLAALTGANGVPISTFVVDEAHLASEWGHDFRPSYLTLPEAHRRICPGAPIALLTATAPRQIRDDLGTIFSRCCTLKMILPESFDRPELSFEVRPVENDIERAEAIKNLITRTIPQSLGAEDFYALHGLPPDAAASDEPVSVRHGGLVFAPWGKGGDFRPAIRVAEIAHMLADARVEAAEYRSSTTDDEGNRTAINRHTQERFKRNELPLVVATKGFGTGIDKPNIRYVLHADMPGSLEALYQEAGRAGRDGQDARAAMIWRPRHSDCVPDLDAPACVANGRCPHGLRELCSFGIQAGLRSSSQPGAAAEVETAITIWRRYFAGEPRGGTVTLPRTLKVPQVTRFEIIDNVEQILGKLCALGLCGPPSAPRDPTLPVFVENKVFDKKATFEAVKRRRPATHRLTGQSDEAFIAQALKLAYDMSDADAQAHTAVWAMFLRHRQTITDKKTAVPRATSENLSDQKPDVERLLTRLVALGVVREYRYGGLASWQVDLTDEAEAPLAQLGDRLAAAIKAHTGRAPEPSALPETWSAAVEGALAALIRSWYATIAVRSWETLESLEEFAAAKDCRRRRIAQYMNESAVTIPSPCGHCDNCGIKPYGELRAQTVDEQSSAAVHRFNRMFDEVLRTADDLDAAVALVEKAAEDGLVDAVRDRAARHLERAPMDPAPRLAAALAAEDLDEQGAAERHARTLVDLLVQRGDVPSLERTLAALPVGLLRRQRRALDSALSPLPATIRWPVAYALATRIGSLDAFLIAADAVAAATARVEAATAHATPASPPLPRPPEPAARSEHT